MRFAHPLHILVATLHAAVCCAVTSIMQRRTSRIRRRYDPSILHWYDWIYSLTGDPAMFVIWGWESWCLNNVGGENWSNAENLENRSGICAYSTTKLHFLTKHWDWSPRHDANSTAIIAASYLIVISSSCFLKRSLLVDQTFPFLKAS